MSVIFCRPNLSAYTNLSKSQPNNRQHLNIYNQLQISPYWVPKIPFSFKKHIAANSKRKPDLMNTFFG